MDGSFSDSEGLVATRSTLLADDNQSSVMSSASGKPSSFDSKTETTDISKFSSLSSGSSTFFGLQQPTAGEQVFASRRPAVQDAIVVEMRNRAIERQVLNALKNDKNEITMTLFPAHLGEVVIKLSMDGQKVRLGFKTTNRDAKEALIESEATLKDTLANSGLILSSLDISADTDARPRQHDAGEQMNHNIPTEDKNAVFSINRLA
jgi:flagellar hook-length control protein FliK